METIATNTEELTQALSMISIPPARSQSLIYLAHIAKIFYCLLLESIKNQPDDLPRARYDDFSEAFHQSLFDLQILTQALLDGQYVPAARVLVMTEKATTQAENDFLKLKISILSTHILTKLPALQQPNGFSMNMGHIFEQRILT